MKNTLERIDPEEMELEAATGSSSLQLHLERYRYAARFLVPGSVADVACGVGYGSYLLATEATTQIESITGIDIDPASIDLAKTRYRHPLIHFECADALTWNNNASFDNIVSLETLEHLPRPEAFVHSLCNRLSPGGRFIASVPVTPSMDANPFHLQDFTPRRFRKMFSEGGLVEMDAMQQVQPYNPLAMAGRKEVRSRELRRGLPAYYLRHPDKAWLRLWSIVKDGFRNKYLVAVFEKPAARK